MRGNTDSTPLARRGGGQTKSAGKAVIIIFFDNIGLIYQHAEPPKTTNEW